MVDVVLSVVPKVILVDVVDDLAPVDVVDFFVVVFAVVEVVPAIKQYVFCSVNLIIYFHYVQYTL